FHCPGAPRALHSFPTRRSSDLVVSPSSARTARPTISAEHTTIATLMNARNQTRVRAEDLFVFVMPLPSKHAVLDRVPERPDVLRSEEHTSELQSRGHLVCRLLL